MTIKNYRFTMDLYNVPVMPFCSLLTVKAPPLILTLRAYWNIFGGSRQLKDFVAVVPMPCCAHIVEQSFVVQVQSTTGTVWHMAYGTWEQSSELGLWE